MEELLTPSEISLITEKCAVNNKGEIYRNIFISQKLDISYISKKGIIFIHGNEHTGKEHIDLRHSITSRKMFEREGKIDNPTKFNIAPIEYPYVADAIYVPENFNVEKNRFPEQFDCYVGKFKYGADAILDYTLLLYAGTKIVHTFYLSSNSKPHNKKVKLPLRQGFCSATHDTQTNVEQYTYSFFGPTGIRKFTVTLLCIYPVPIEKWYLTVFDQNGNQYFSHHLYNSVPEYIMDVPWKMIQVDFHDNPKLDKIIMAIIDGKYEFERDFEKFCDYSYI